MAFCKKVVINYFGIKEGSFYKVIKEVRNILKARIEEENK